MTVTGLESESTLKKQLWNASLNYRASKHDFVIPLVWYSDSWETTKSLGHLITNWGKKTLLQCGRQNTRSKTGSLTFHHDVTNWKAQPPARSPKKAQSSALCDQPTPVRDHNAHQDRNTNKTDLTHIRPTQCLRCSFYSRGQSHLARVQRRTLPQTGLLKFAVIQCTKLSC
jgi:hypothetical protein